MATDVILPALGMSQDTGKIIQWLKAEGDQVAKDEPLVEIETDKATVEIEAPASGVLARVSAAAGEDIPVGQVIAAILTPEELQATGKQTGVKDDAGKNMVGTDGEGKGAKGADAIHRVPTTAVSPLAARIAAEHNVDLSQVKSSGRRIQQADVLSHIQNQENAPVGTRFIASAPSINASSPSIASVPVSTSSGTARLTMASPKARRLAMEQGVDLTVMKGSGPQGAVLAADV